MSYHIEQVVLASNKLFKKPPEPISNGKNEIAVVLHLFYADLWKEVRDYLDALDTPHDLYITVPETSDDSVFYTLFADRPDAKIYRVENRGRDVLPFLLVGDLIGTQRYRYICKLHTKKTGNSPLGHVWRKLLYFDLIGSQRTVSDILSIFENDDTIGQITGKNTVLDSKRYAYGNNTKIKQLCEMSGIPFDESYNFAGGTMFWTRASLLEPLLRLFRDDKIPFEEERGQKDHTWAHAVERFFGLIAKAKGMRIAPSPSNYAALPAATVEETAALVLGQQYAGQDVYEKINELNDYVHELEALAESMRIKNRLKRLPSQILSFAKVPSIPSFSSRNGILSRSSADKTTISTARLLRTLHPAAVKKAFYYLRRGEIGFMLRRIREKLLQQAEEDKRIVPVDPSDYFETFDTKRYDIGEIPIDIVIPVYNGYEYLEKLFDSMRDNTTSPYRLIVVNDASDDHRVLPYLKERLREFPESLLLENETNLGFVKSVTRAVASTRNHFVLLNTDTEVPPMWLERLMYPIFHMPNVASTTPFTNAGTIASFPVFLEDNPPFEDLDVSTIDNCFKEVRPDAHYAPLPTGVGFCMGVNRRLTEEIGFFDTETFGKGYGEENDWCQRAIKHGYRNLLVPNLYVYHKHGGSFPSELKRKLLEENRLKLLRKHPDYDKQVQDYIAADPHKTLRKLLVLTVSSRAKRMHVIFDHGLGGGANKYADEKIDEMVNADENTLLIRYDFYGKRFILRHRYKNYDNGFAVQKIEQLDTILRRTDVGYMLLNNLVAYPYPQEILEYLDDYLRKKPHIRLIVPLHDYYCICPSYTLLDAEGNYCGIPDDLETCRRCMAHNNQEWRTFYTGSVDIDTWRELWQKILLRADEITAFSRSSAELLRKAYPILLEKEIRHIPHTVDDIEPVDIEPKSDTDLLTIGILGAINYAKGASVVKAMVERIEANDLPYRVVVIGEITEPIRSDRFVATGKYKREALTDIVRHHRVDIFTIPSIWPETFSYTAEEVMRMGLPLVVFDIGAPAERVKVYAKGKVVSEISANALLDGIATLANEIR